MLTQHNLSNTFFPSLNDLKKNNIKITFAPVVIDYDTKETIIARSLLFEKFEDINIDQITHFYSIEKEHIMTNANIFFVVNIR